VPAARPSRGQDHRFNEESISPRDFIFLFGMDGGKYRLGSSTSLSPTCIPHLSGLCCWKYVSPRTIDDKLNADPLNTKMKYTVKLCQLFQDLVPGVDDVDFDHANILGYSAVVEDMSPFITCRTLPVRRIWSVSLYSSQSNPISWLTTISASLN
jgi:hypothetical protein